METGSVTSSQAAVTASNAQAQLRSRQADQEQQAQQTQQNSQSQQNQQVQARRSVNESETAARAQSEQSRPTVNASGQVVGTRVNTTA